MSTKIQCSQLHDFSNHLFTYGYAGQLLAVNVKNHVLTFKTINKVCQLPLCQFVYDKAKLSFTNVFQLMF